jgi:hypothetical protein
VDAVAQVFYDQRSAPDQLKQVVRAVLLSSEFRTTWGAKVKRPFEVVVSAMRAGMANFPFDLVNDSTDTFFWLFGNSGQRALRAPQPGRLSRQAGGLVVSQPRVACWRLLTWLMDEPGGSTFYMDVVAQTPANIRSANQLTDHWIERVFGRPLSAADRAAVVAFMAQGLSPDLALPWNDSVKNRCGRWWACSSGRPSSSTAERAAMCNRHHPPNSRRRFLASSAHRGRPGGRHPHLAFGDPDAINEDLLVVVFLRGASTASALRCPSPVPTADTTRPRARACASP